MVENIPPTRVNPVDEQCMFTRVVVIEFCHVFIDDNYLSLNHQLMPITITKVAY